MKRVVDETQRIGKLYREHQPVAQVLKAHPLGKGTFSQG